MKPVTRISGYVVFMIISDHWWW